MGTSPLQGNVVSGRGSARVSRARLRRPVEDLFERLATVRLACPAGRRTLHPGRVCFPEIELRELCVWLATMSHGRGEEGRRWGPHARRLWI